MFGAPLPAPRPGGVAAGGAADRASWALQTVAAINISAMHAGRFFKAGGRTGRGLIIETISGERGAGARARHRPPATQPGYWRSDTPADGLATGDPGVNISGQQHC